MGGTSDTVYTAFQRGVKDFIDQRGKLESVKPYENAALNEAYDEGANTTETWLTRRRKTKVLCKFCEADATKFGAQSTDLGKTIDWVPICDGHANGWNEGGDWIAPVVPIEPVSKELKILDPQIQKAIHDCPSSEKIDNLVEETKETEASKIINKKIETRIRFLLGAGTTQEEILDALEG